MRGLRGVVRAVGLITAKDLRLRTRDRSAYLMGVVAPLGLALILSVTIGDAISDDIDMDVAVLDQDHGPVTEGLMAALAELEEVDVAPEALEGFEADVREAIDDGEQDAVLVVPAGFSDAVMAPGLDTEVPPLRVIGDVNHGIATAIATAIADGFATRVDAGRLSVATVLAGPGGGGDLGTLVPTAMAREAPVQVVQLPAGDRELDGATYLVAGISGLFLFFTVQLGVTGLLEERQKGTLARLGAAPIPRVAVPLAKALGSVVLGLASLAVLVVASSVLMGADWGDPGAVAVIGVAVVLAAVSVMGVVAAMARTPEQAGSYQAMIAMILAIMGGAFFPVSQSGSELLERLAALTPHHWFLRGLGDAQSGLGAAWPSVLALLAFAVVAGAIGALALRLRGRAAW